MRVCVSYLFRAVAVVTVVTVVAVVAVGAVGAAGAVVVEYVGSALS